MDDIEIERERERERERVRERKRDRKRKRERRVEEDYECLVLHKCCISSGSNRTELISIF